MPQPHELLGLDLDDPEVAAAIQDSESFAALIDVLVTARKKLALTQQQVAVRMGTTQSAVSDLERVGGDPRVSTIQRYARAVGGRLHMLFNNAPEHLTVIWASDSAYSVVAPATPSLQPSVVSSTVRYVSWGGVQQTATSSRGTVILAGSNLEDR